MSAKIMAISIRVRALCARELKSQSIPSACDGILPWWRKRHCRGGIRADHAVSGWMSRSMIGPAAARASRSAYRPEACPEFSTSAEIAGQPRGGVWRYSSLTSHDIVNSLRRHMQGHRQRFCRQFVWRHELGFQDLAGVCRRDRSAGGNAAKIRAPQVFALDCHARPHSSHSAMPTSHASPLMKRKQRCHGP
jgi:hypothetical protein